MIFISWGKRARKREPPKRKPSVKVPVYRKGRKEYTTGRKLNRALRMRDMQNERLDNAFWQTPKGKRNKAQIDEAGSALKKLFDAKPKNAAELPKWQKDINANYKQSLVELGKGYQALIGFLKKEGAYKSIIERYKAELKELKERIMEAD